MRSRPPQGPRQRVGSGKQMIRKRKPAQLVVTGGVGPDLRDEQFGNIEKCARTLRSTEMADAQCGHQKERISLM